MTYNKPEQFTDKQVSIFHNMNIILDNLSKKIESLNGAARFLHTRLNEQEGRIDMLEKLNMKLVEGFGKESSDEIHKRIGSVLNEEDTPNNPLGSEEDGCGKTNSIIQSPSTPFKPSEKPKRMVKKETLQTIFHDSPKKPERKYKKKFPKKKLGRPRKPNYKQVYNPDIDETKSGIE